MAQKIITRAINLPLSADTVWQLVQRPKTFAYLTSPLMSARTEIPDQAFTGLVMKGRLFFLSVIPLWVHRLEMKKVDSQLRMLETDEHGGPFRVWRHRIEVASRDESSCEYRDTLEIDAGRLTPILAYSVRFMFFYRHLRWRSLGRLLSD